jgi:hypothetical protein
MLRSITFFLLCFHLAACGPQGPSSDMRRAADEEVKREFSSIDIERLQVEAKENRYTWEFYYTGGPDAAGGPIIVIVNKKTVEVQQMKAWQ